MKKIAFIGLLFSFFIISSCASIKPVMFDENHPIEKSAKLIVINTILITAYNGIEIQRTPDPLSALGFSTSWKPVTYIPAGVTELELTSGFREYHYYGTGMYDYTWTYDIYKDKRVKYNFEAGITYILIPARYDGVFGVNIYKDKYKKENLITFVPAYN